MIKISRELAAKALMFVKQQNPSSILDRLVMLMMALEDSNFHTENEKLQQESGIDIRNFYGSKWEDAGVKLAHMLGWDGITAAWVIVASCETDKDKRGLLALLKASGIDITQSTKKASSSSAQKVEEQIRKTLSQFESDLEGSIKALAKRYERYERDPRVETEQDTLGAEMGQLQSHYMYLVSDAKKELERSIEKTLKVVEEILESAEELKKGLDRMDDM